MKPCTVFSMRTGRGAPSGWEACLRHAIPPTLLALCLLLTACQIPRRDTLPNPKSCRSAESMRIAIVGECVFGDI